MATATNLYVCDYRDGNLYTDWTSDAVTLCAGYGYSGSNWVTVIKFTLESPASSLSISLTNANAAGAYRVLNYKILENEDSSYNNATYTADSDGTVTMASQNFSDITLTVNETYAAGTYYLYLWTSKSTSSTCYSLISHNGNGKVTVTYEEVETYELTVSAGTGSTIKVSRTSSPSGLTGTLSNGAVIYAGDVLEITFAASTGYNLSTRTVNGSTFTSGNTHTVSAAVTVKSTATVKSFTLSISAGTGSTITVNRTSSPKKGASTGNLSDGATVYYSDVLKITTAASAGYEIATQTVNDIAFTSGDTHTVTANVTIVTLTNTLGLVYIDNGTTLEAYLIYIDNGSSWDQHIPYIDNGSGWDMCN